MSTSCRAEPDSARLFVYGSLRRGGRPNPVRRRLARHARWCGLASLPGRLYRVAGYPGAVPSADPAERVHGEIWQLRNPALWPLLDAFENCVADSPLPHEYRRERVLAQLSGGARVDTWIYWYNRPVRGLRRIESGDFLAPG